MLLHKELSAFVNQVFDSATTLGTWARRRQWIDGLCLVCGDTKGKVWLDFMISFATNASPSSPFPPGSALPPAPRLSPNLHVRRGGGTSDNLDQFASNDGLTGTVEENLVLVDHLAGVLGGVLQGGRVSNQGRGALAGDRGGAFHLRPWRCDGQTARRRGPQPDPSRWRWRGSTRAGWAGAPHRPRTQRSFLESFNSQMSAKGMAWCVCAITRFSHLGRHPLLG